MQRRLDPAKRAPSGCVYPRRIGEGAEEEKVFVQRVERAEGADANASVRDGAEERELGLRVGA